MDKVTLEDVTKRYGSETLAANSVSLSIADGEFITLVGPSGCGKTTTLRTIAGFTEPTSGRILIDGDDVTEVPTYKRNIGMVFQDFALFPHMTVAENVSYGLKISDGYDDSEITDRVDEMLELVELSETRSRMPDELSGGQQQRIALARALAPEPEVLLLDEPLASLDKKLRETMQVELQRIQQQVDITTIFVTHNQEEALSMSDRVAVMNDGQIEQVGAPTEVYKWPETQFVADFVGKSNIFSGTIKDQTDDRIIVDCGEERLSILADDTYQAGTEITVTTRPESVSVRATDRKAADGGESVNSFTGELNTKRYQGGVAEYHIETTTGKNLVAMELYSGADELSIGDKLSLNIAPSDYHIIS